MGWPFTAQSYVHIHLGFWLFSGTVSLPSKCAQVWSLSVTYNKKVTIRNFGIHWSKRQTKEVVVPLFLSCYYLLSAFTSTYGEIYTETEHCKHLGSSLELTSFSKAVVVEARLKSWFNMGITTKVTREYCPVFYKKYESAFSPWIKHVQSHHIQPELIPNILIHFYKERGTTTRECFKFCLTKLGKESRFYSMLLMSTYCSTKPELISLMIILECTQFSKGNMPENTHFKPFSS